MALVATFFSSTCVVLIPENGDCRILTLNGQLLKILGFFADVEGIFMASHRRGQNRSFRSEALVTRYHTEMAKLTVKLGLKNRIKKM